MQGESMQGEGAHSRLHSGEHKLTPCGNLYANKPHSVRTCSQWVLVSAELLKKERLCHSPVDSPEDLTYSRPQLEHRNILTRRAAWGDLAIKEITRSRVGEGPAWGQTSVEDGGGGQAAQAAICAEKHRGAGNASSAISKVKAITHDDKMLWDLPLELHVSQDTLQPEL